MQNFEFIAPSDTAAELRRLRQSNPLIHCITNEVVQEITANVLLAAGASSAMVVAEEEAGDFAGVASALLINLGTPYGERLNSMYIAVHGAEDAGRPWVLDPVAAGGLPWRNDIIREFVQMSPTVIRGNASEILYLAGFGHGGKGVDSIDSSDSAVPAAVSLAKSSGSVVVVTGAKDYITDGKRILCAEGGDPIITKVVGTGCSLSALMAAFVAGAEDAVKACAACCAYVNRASETAAASSHGPGSFHNAYLDALYLLQPEDFEN